MDIVYFVIVGLIGGGMLASTGAIGPFMVPALMILGLSSGFARGTSIVSEFFVTLVCIVGHKRVSNMDRRVILAFLPGAFVAFLGTNASIEFPELFMKLAIGAFEIVIGAIMIFAALKWASRPSFRTVNSKTVMAKLMLVAIFAGFAKGFFGAGWGPIGVGLFILLGIDPRITIGSSLVIRLLLDGVAGVTYAGLNLVNINSVIVLTVAGCVSALLGVKLTTVVAERNLRILLGGVVMFLGAFVVAQTLL